MISPTIPQCGMQNGNLTTTLMPIQAKRFYVPLISSVMGILIPPANYQLLPLKSLYGTNL